MNTLLSPNNAVDLVPPPGLPPIGCEGGELVRALMAVGIKHELGCRGPVKFDCYAMMQLVQWHLFGRVVSSIDLGADASGRAVLSALALNRTRRAWRLNAGRPRHGDAVTMSHMHEPFHIGTFLDIDRGVVVHCASFAGLVCDDTAALRASGWGKICFYSYRGAAS